MFTYTFFDPKSFLSPFSGSRTPEAGIQMIHRRGLRNDAEIAVKHAQLWFCTSETNEMGNSLRWRGTSSLLSVQTPWEDDNGSCVMHRSFDRAAVPDSVTRSVRSRHARGRLAGAAPWSPGVEDRVRARAPVQRFFAGARARDRQALQSERATPRAASSSRSSRSSGCQGMPPQPVGKSPISGWNPPAAPSSASS